MEATEIFYIREFRELSLDSKISFFQMVSELGEFNGVWRTEGMIFYKITLIYF
jgi:hypothetical protein